ncbi:hypothetical protein JZO72_09045 [Vagococcus fluvialis]|uniref:hypothetical protein n=1 Tax=Vagococcus fluvialis TaxID=2738 RepID=UPI001A8F9A32|nr:hypothetical protein [Vagococcus fluvialis]MBO0479772.1 hypothetical protein [Vagococcus fluvialis]MBO0483326.1 hypothetical protein [Vagococcus fluvialis]
MKDSEKCKRRVIYKNRNKSEYNEVFKYFSSVIEFTKDDECESVKKNIKEIDLSNDKVWALFGGENENNLQCLQVACSENILSEIEEDIDFMFDKTIIYKGSVDNEETIIKNSKFYEHVYEIPKSGLEKEVEKRKYSYKNMYNSYSSFKICILDVDRYLNIEKSMRKINDDQNNIVEIAKHGYAEAKLAYETLSLYWNSYNSGIDGKTISYFLKNDEL